MAEDQQEPQTDLWSAYAAEGISSTSLSDHDKEIRELRQQVQDPTAVLEAMSLTQRQLSEREARSDYFSQRWKSWQDGWWHDEKWTKTPRGGQLVGQCKIILESLAGSGSLGVDGRISTEALLQPDAVESILKVLDAQAGWIQEDESKLLLRKALFRVERGKDESLRQYTTRRLAQIEAASAAVLVTMPTTSLGHSAEGRRTFVKAGRTEPQYTLERQHGTR